MGAVKDTYDIIKDLLSEARKLKNYEFADMVLDIQQRFFDLNNENQELKRDNIEKEKTIHDLSDIKTQFENLKFDYDRLQESLTLMNRADDLSFLETEIVVNYTEYVYIFSDRPLIKNSVKEKIKDIFYRIAPNLFSSIDEITFVQLFQREVNGTYSVMDDNMIGKIKAKLIEYNLIEIINAAKGASKVKLTEFGQQVLNKINQL